MNLNRKCIFKRNSRSLILTGGRGNKKKISHLHRWHFWGFRQTFLNVYLWGLNLHATWLWPNIKLFLMRTVCVVKYTPGLFFFLLMPSWWFICNDNHSAEVQPPNPVWVFSLSLFLCSFDHIKLWSTSLKAMRKVYFDFLFFFFSSPLFLCKANYKTGQRNFNVAWYWRFNFLQENDHGVYFLLLCRFAN